MGLIKLDSNKWHNLYVLTWLEEQKRTEWAKESSHRNSYVYTGYLQKQSHVTSLLVLPITNPSIY